MRSLYSISNCIQLHKLERPVANTAVQDTVLSRIDQAAAAAVPQRMTRKPATLQQSTPLVDDLPPSSLVVLVARIFAVRQASRRRRSYGGIARVSTPVGAPERSKIEITLFYCEMVDGTRTVRTVLVQCIAVALRLRAPRGRPRIERERMY